VIDATLRVWVAVRWSTKMIMTEGFRKIPEVTDLLQMAGELCETGCTDFASRIHRALLRLDSKFERMDSLLDETVWLSHRALVGAEPVRIKLSNPALVSLPGGRS
jgi:hypothetical protein